MRKGQIEWTGSSGAKSCIGDTATPRENTDALGEARGNAPGKKDLVAQHESDEKNPRVSGDAARPKEKEESIKADRPLKQRLESFFNQDFKKQDKTSSRKNSRNRNAVSNIGAIMIDNVTNEGVKKGEARKK